MQVNRELAIIAVFCAIFSTVTSDNVNVVEEFESTSGLYNIEGKVYAPEIFSAADTEWQRDTSITINDREYSGFLKEDGTFVISGVPSGSYVVEISNPDYYYESVRKQILFYIVTFSYFSFFFDRFVLKSIRRASFVPEN